jgi:hypothetical protein
MITDINYATYMSDVKYAHLIRYRILKNTGIRLTLMVEIKDTNGIWQSKRIGYEYTRGIARKVREGKIVLS